MGEGKMKMKKKRNEGENEGEKKGKRKNGKERKTKTMEGNKVWGFVGKKKRCENNVESVCLSSRLKCLQSLQ